MTGFVEFEEALCYTVFAGKALRTTLKRRKKYEADM